MKRRADGVAVLTPFSGYPPELVAEWCAVSLKTAYRYKAAAGRPSRSALALFRLHAEGRVLGVEWEGWRFSRDRLYTPAGDWFSRSVLEHYRLIYQLAMENLEPGSDLDHALRAWDLR